MITCAHCGNPNPDDARYCMNCGQALQRASVGDAGSTRRPTIGGFSMFGLSIAGSLLLSFILMFALKLPVFLLFGFLPLLWWRRKD